MKIYPNKIQKYYMDVSSVSKHGLYEYFIMFLKPENVGAFDYEIEGVHYLSVGDEVDLFMKPESKFAKKQGLIELDVEYLLEYKLAIKKYFSNS